MGALEFAPTKGPDPTEKEDIQVAELIGLASAILSERDDLESSVATGTSEDGLLRILSVGMSAGGARAKAIIAWHPETGRVRSGQVPAPPGFEHWLLKFDGIGGDSERESLQNPEGFGAIEQQFRRLVFNVVARNQDDHVKNIGFLMDRGGSWSLSPAFDITRAGGGPATTRCR